MVFSFGNMSLVRAEVLTFFMVLYLSRQAALRLRFVFLFCAGSVGAGVCSGVFWMLCVQLFLRKWVTRHYKELAVREIDVARARMAY
jgi:hypothetical protein